MYKFAVGMTDGTRNVGMQVPSAVLPWTMAPSEQCLEAHKSI